MAAIRKLDSSSIEHAVEILTGSRGGRLFLR